MAEVHSADIIAGYTLQQANKNTLSRNFFFITSDLLCKSTGKAKHHPIQNKESAMSKKLAAQALDALLSSQSTISKKNTSTATSTTVLKKRTKKGKVQKDRLPATKTGLKKIKHELRYGHSVRRTQEEREAKENPLGNVVLFFFIYIATLLGTSARNLPA